MCSRDAFATLSHAHWPRTKYPSGIVPRSPGTSCVGTSRSPRFAFACSPGKQPDTGWARARLTFQGPRRQ